jgi:hypothetical protein
LFSLCCADGSPTIFPVTPRLENTIQSVSEVLVLVPPDQRDTSSSKALPFPSIVVIIIIEQAIIVVDEREDWSTFPYCGDGWGHMIRGPTRTVIVGTAVRQESCSNASNWTCNRTLTTVGQPRIQQQPRNIISGCWAEEFTTRRDASQPHAALMPNQTLWRLKQAQDSRQKFNGVQNRFHSPQYPAGCA